MGDNHYQRYVDHRRAHSSRRAGHVGTGLLAHAPRRDGAQPAEPLLLIVCVRPLCLGRAGTTHGQD